MRFLTMVKVAETAGMPPPELLDAIDRIGQEAARAGVLLDTAGLAPTAMGARIRLSDGEVTVTEGPFDEPHEVVAGYALFDVKSKAEAVQWTTRFVKLHKDHWPGWEGEIEIRQVLG